MKKMKINRPMTGTSAPKEEYFALLKKDFKKNKALYLLFLLPLAWYVVFCYIPMYGLLMSFEDYNIRLGILHSDWTGFENFRRFFSDPYFGRYIWNTVRISIWAIAINFPVPIIFALLINEISNKYFVKTIQTVTYMPHFISLVVICGIVQTFVSPEGVIVRLITMLTGQNIETSLLNNPRLFAPIFVLSGTWQSTGFASIIYVAALTGVDKSLIEAAQIDGAGHFKRLLNVTIPAIMPTIVVMFILRLGSALSADYEKVLLLINQLNAEKAEVLSYYIYKRGIVESNYGISTAAGLFNAIINVIFVVSANRISRRVSETSLW